MDALLASNSSIAAPTFVDSRAEPELSYSISEAILLLLRFTDIEPVGSASITYPMAILCEGGCGCVPVNPPATVGLAYAISPTLNPEVSTSLTVPKAETYPKELFAILCVVTPNTVPNPAVPSAVNFSINILSEATPVAYTTEPFSIVSPDWFLTYM